MGMKNLIALLCIIVMGMMLSSCNYQENAYRILEESGYSQIQLKGYDIFSCSEDDMVRTKFTAKNNAGNMVNGVVCAAPLKGSTIRLF